MTTEGRGARGWRRGGRPPMRRDFIRRGAGGAGGAGGRVPGYR